MSHALRLDRNRRRALRLLLFAGDGGLALMFMQIPGDVLALLVDFELAEYFTDPARILTDRVRITEHGRWITTVLCLPTPSKGTS